MSDVRGSNRGQRVEIWTDKYRLGGYIHVPQVIALGAARLFDVRNDPARHFIPLTRVGMYRRGDDQAVAQQEFLLVNRASIEVIRPLD